MKQQTKIVSQLTLTAAHKEALRRLAAEEHEAMAQVVRDLIKEAARRRGLWPDLAEDELLAEVAARHRRGFKEALAKEGITLDDKDDMEGGS